jgi:vacuolar-type H+-ATPase subunit I/STV1
MYGCPNLDWDGMQTVLIKIGTKTRLVCNIYAKCVLDSEPHKNTTLSRTAFFFILEVVFSMRPYVFDIEEACYILFLGLIFTVNVFLNIAIFCVSWITDVISYARNFFFIFLLSY